MWSGNSGIIKHSENMAIWQRVNCNVKHSGDMVHGQASPHACGHAKRVPLGTFNYDGYSNLHIEMVKIQWSSTETVRQF